MIKSIYLKLPYASHAIDDNCLFAVEIKDKSKAEAIIAELNNLAGLNIKSLKYEENSLTIDSGIKYEAKNYKSDEETKFFFDLFTFCCPILFPGTAFGDNFYKLLYDVFFTNNINSSIVNEVAFEFNGGEFLHYDFIPTKTDENWCRFPKRPYEMAGMYQSHHFEMNAIYFNELVRIINVEKIIIESEIISKYESIWNESENEDDISEFSKLIWSKLVDKYLDLNSYYKTITNTYIDNNFETQLRGRIENEFNNNEITNENSITIEELAKWSNKEIEDVYEDWVAPAEEEMAKDILNEKLYLEELLLKCLIFDIDENFNSQFGNYPSFHYNNFIDDDLLNLAQNTYMSLWEELKSK